MLQAELTGNKKLFRVNQNHPLYSEIHSIVRKYFGLDKIIEGIADRLGDLTSVYLTGDIAQGKDVDLIDLILIGDIDQSYLVQLIRKTEDLIKRKIRYLVYSEQEFIETKEQLQNLLLVWGSDI
jgi:hypothetical protein